MAFPTTSGIYTITNLVNGKMYVGYTISFQSRWNEHSKDLRKNNHKNVHLQNAYNQYGIENLVFEILEECEEQYLKSQEHYWAILLSVHSEEFGYNMQPTHPYGNARPTVEAIQKGLIKKKGLKLSEDHKNRIRIANTGYKVSEETKQKLREINTGKKQSRESIEKMMKTSKERRELGIKIIKPTKEELIASITFKEKEKTKRVIILKEVIDVTEEIKCKIDEQCIKSNKNYTGKRVLKEILMFNKEGELLHHFRNSKDAEYILKVPRTTIQRKIVNNRFINGFILKYIIYE